jgi:hypothetical protein
MARTIDPRTSDVPLSYQEQRVHRLIDYAFAYAWPDGGPNGRSSRYPLHELFDLLMRSGNEGYVLVAAVFARKAAEREIARDVRAHVMTGLARALHEFDGSRAEPRESQVAHFGRFINAVIEGHPNLHVEWAEDMHTGIDGSGLLPQPTSVIRGALLAPSVDQRRAVGFWRLSVSSERFPCRIFSDPCHPDDGSIFSSYHSRVFGLVFSVAPVEAVRRFAEHMRAEATRKLVRRWDEERRASFIEAIEADENDRQRAFRSIIGHIADDRNRHEAANSLGLSAP